MDKGGCEVSLAKDMQGKLPRPNAVRKILIVLLSFIPGFAALSGDGIKYRIPGDRGVPDTTRQSSLARDIRIY